MDADAVHELTANPPPPPFVAPPAAIPDIPAGLSNQELYTLCQQLFDRVTSLERKFAVLEWQSALTIEAHNLGVAASRNTHIP